MGPFFRGVMKCEALKDPGFRVFFFFSFFFVGGVVQVSN